MAGWSDTHGNIYIADQTRIRKIDVFGIMSTVCGTGRPGFTADGAPATATLVSYVSSLWGDSLGNLFYIDEDFERLRKINAMTSIVTTVVVSYVDEKFTDENVTDGANWSRSNVSGYYLTGDSAGNLYYSDYSYYAVIKLEKSSGRVLAIAGNGTCAYGGELVVATSSGVYVPTGLAVDTLGNVFFVEEMSDRIRRVTKAGIMQTIVGTGRNGCNDEDELPGTSTDLCYPSALSIDSLGNLFWVEVILNGVRKYTLSTGLVGTLIAGYGANYAGKDSMILSSPLGIWSNSRGDLFIADTYNYRVRSMVNKIISTVAGTGYSYGGDEGSPATSASVDTPGSLWGDTLGTVYFADIYNYRIRAISATGIITTLGGMGKNVPFTADGTAFTSMSLSNLQALSGDSNGNIYFFDNGRLRRYIVSSSSVQTLAGNGVSGYNGNNVSASRVYFSNPRAIWVNTMGDVYIAEPNNQRVRLYNHAMGRVWDFAGNGSTRYGGDNVLATETTLWNPYGVWGDTVGNVFISDYSNLRIRRVQLNGIITTFAGNGMYDRGSDGVSATSVPIGYPTSVSGDSL
eukprot:gene27193-biopygen3851